MQLRAMDTLRSQTIAAVHAEMDRIEARVLRSRRTVKELLTEAKIDPALWWRWRQGTHEPRRSTWRRVVDAADKLAPRRGRT